MHNTLTITNSFPVSDQQQTMLLQFFLSCGFKADETPVRGQ
jgi:hypothetical protein